MEDRITIDKSKYDYLMQANVEAAEAKKKLKKYQDENTIIIQKDFTYCPEDFNPIMPHEDGEIIYYPKDKAIEEICTKHNKTLNDLINVNGTLKKSRIKNDLLMKRSLIARIFNQKIKQI